MEAREIYPSLDQINKSQRDKSQSEEQKVKGIFRPKSEIQAVFPAEIGNQVISKKKCLHPKNVTKYGVSPQKTLIWTSIWAPEAPSLLISSGHSPRLGGHNFRLGEHKQSVGGAQAVSWGGTVPICPPVAPGLLDASLPSTSFRLLLNTYCVKCSCYVTVMTLK